MINHRFSLITPEHDPRNIPYLLELWHTIHTQTYGNWEWVLFINNGFTLGHVPEQIRQDPRVKIYELQEPNVNVGYLKNRAFNLGTGDVLVEMDHDDLLFPHCLERLNQAYQDPQIGFVYSDDATMHMTQEFQPYDESNGWTYKKVQFGGRELISMNSFEPSSHSVAYIWYAPDHVRSWRRSVYHQIGGHNVDLSICDDHDLLVRTYLATEMLRIPEALYVYRITGNNTWLARCDAIQDTTRAIFRQNAQILAERDADRRGLAKLDLGGGINARPGYINIDMSSRADLRHDLRNGIPFPDNSVGVINASHIIEHLPDKNFTMREIHRVLAHGGWAFIEVPSTDGRGAYQDPTHVSYWNENSFLYYTDNYLAQFIENTDIRFQEYRRDTHFPNDWMRNLNVCVTSAWLVAIKDPNGPRFPGPLKI